MLDEDMTRSSLLAMKASERLCWGERHSVPSKMLASAAACFRQKLDMIKSHNWSYFRKSTVVLPSAKPSLDGLHAPRIGVISRHFGSFSLNGLLQTLPNTLVQAVRKNYAVSPNAKFVSFFATEGRHPYEM